MSAFKEHREKVRLTQDQLATLCNVNINAIRAYEKGKMVPSLLVSKRLVNHLNMTYEKLAEHFEKHREE